MTDGVGVTISNLDVLGIFRLILRNGKKYQAITLNDIEEVLDPKSEEYKAIRKIVLDNFNNCTRSSLSIIFGDIDYSWH